MEKKSAGFTLIELLVVFTIMGILLGIGMSAYSDFNQRQQVVQAARKIKNQLRSAQSNALAGEKNCDLLYCGGVCYPTPTPPGTLAGCTSYKCSPSEAVSKKLNGWFVDFSNKKIYGTCGTPEIKFGETGFDIPSNVVISAYGSAGSITTMHFYPLDQGADETTICVTALGRIYELMVAPSGDINEYGIVTTCP